MPTVLITGANRGLGLEFARAYAADGWQVLATCRSKDRAGTLADMVRNVQVEELDLADLADVQGFADRLSVPAIDLLVSNAGVMGPGRIETPDDAREWLQALQANAVAPVLLARRLAPKLKTAKGKAVAVTSRMGSIADNDSGGAIAYRSSKAALNAAWKSLAIELARDGVSAAVLHPGWVQTRMGGSSAPLTPEQSVAGMRRVIAGLTPERFGFYNYDGATIPW
jgi:NAD(P)-dependent dehydrogenase (short-subunit alcohol dehydrogenase family)